MSLRMDFQQHVVAVHVPGGREKAAVALPGLGAGGVRSSMQPPLPPTSTPTSLSSSGSASGTSTQQTGHHHRLVHVVHGADEAIHGVKSECFWL